MLSIVDFDGYFYVERSKDMSTWKVIRETVFPDSFFLTNDERLSYIPYYRQESTQKRIYNKIIIA